MMHNIVGKAFGKLKVIGSLPSTKAGNMWQCVCACGDSFTKSTHSLTSGKAKGCHSCNNGWKLRPYESLYNQLLIVCKKRGYTCTITYTHFLMFVLIDECHYCGEHILWKPYGNLANGYKLDRKNNKLGYTLANCVVCCTRCNKGKNQHFSYEEWLAVGALIKSWRAAAEVNDQSNHGSGVQGVEVLGEIKA